ncbi:MAG: ferritin-like domain-containing protein [Pseudomonadota bacterium]|nr:ferritin-like domain-containing protein [Pseudomonadota bacterium]
MAPKVLTKEKIAGMNRTGIGMSPVDGDQMVQGAREGAPTSEGSSAGLQTVREQYIAERTGIGSMPPPTSLKGVAKAAAAFVRDQRPNVFLDRLGERLAFERTGVRLYDALLTHVSVVSDKTLGPTVAELRTIRDEEHRHFELLRNTIQSMGADPTAQTPAADAVSVESHGLLQILTDPRSSRSQCLHAILVAELADNEGWQTLIQLARTLGHDDLVTRFEQAWREEVIHLERVRGWFSAQMMADMNEGRIGVEA